MGRRLGQREFVALIAFLFSMIAIGTDAMLPALQQMGMDLGVVERRWDPVIITIFVLGTGVGQVFAGPLSDAYGRKPVLISGLGLFVLASIFCLFTASFTHLLIARFIQGLGISAIRSVAIALVRDVYKGREMAKVISLAMMLFVLAPTIAPFLGQTLMLAFSWRAIFFVFVLTGLLAILWLGLRQEETLRVEGRIPLSVPSLKDNTIEVLSHRRVQISLICQSLAYGIVFCYISLAQQVYVVWLDVGTDFPLYFAITSMIALFANALNARLVEKLGMWVISTSALLILFIFSGVYAVLIWGGLISADHLLFSFVFWSCFAFFMNALCFGNLNALAMEPMGHMAGMAAAITGAISTTFSVLIAMFVGWLYNGSGITLVLAVACLSLLAFLASLFNPRKV
ncbi:MFS transporter [Amylibacter marinus]|uniref:MFS transporter n=1 Tax=Amylibacter marinus TaxID=1475483 RepID=A0ABQ5VSJ8_9RHOB|nr:multidrug effflux MFS transporter [Amylibacter marinus]GLQ34305.1 MFS transporter [Amylibacter marinus]